MGENTAIEWAHHTFNPWEGCQKVGPGCDHCYAETRDIRYTGGTHWGPGAPRRRTSASNWAKPLKWNREAAANGVRYRVFCASLADVFDNAVDPAWRVDLWNLIRATPQLDWEMLTKRIGNVLGMLPPDWGEGYPNVWIGATIVNQTEADRDIPKLLAVPAAIRFLSMEPLLGPVDLRAVWTYCPTHDFADGFCLGPCPDRRRLSWIICGGESGANSRPMHPDWARSLRDQCEAAGVAFLFKQWGEWGADALLYTDMRGNCPPPNMKIGKKKAGRLLDGREWNGFPHSAEAAP